MKILITGVSGQVGLELHHQLAGTAEVLAMDRSGMNLAKPDMVRSVIRQFQPDLILNAAAYTAVDQAEQERALAFAINADAPALMAEEARRIGAALIHYSTDYVFDGQKEGAYVEDDAPAPLNVYGQSKLAGEQAILEQDVAALIFRTQWVYGLHGKNFLLTMLNLGKTRTELRVVNDQHGAPTWSRSIARATAGVIHAGSKASRHWWREKSGIYHLVAQGETSWCGFAQRIFELSALEPRPAVVGIGCKDYPTPAPRPKNSRMSCLKFEQTFFPLPTWDTALAECMRSAAAR